VRALGHVGVSVPDLDRAIEWYGDVLGFDLLVGPEEIDADDGHPGLAAKDVFGAAFQRVRMAHLVTANGVGIELFRFVEPPAERREDNFEFAKSGFFHICVVERDIARFVARIVATGGRLRSERLWDAFPGEPYRWCYCEDPFGNIIEVHTHTDERVYSNRRVALPETS
jgi:catechol 2,3-dioxygenase-like lactoylglutathione lyase family enzyme